MTQIQKKGLVLKDLERSLLYQEAYEPGSTMKVLTVASSIDNGTFDPNETYTNNEYVIADAKLMTGP